MLNKRTRTTIFKLKGQEHEKVKEEGKMRIPFKFVNMFIRIKKEFILHSLIMSVYIKMKR